MTPQVVLVLVTVFFSNTLSILPVSKFQKSLGIFSHVRKLLKLLWTSFTILGNHQINFRNPSNMKTKSVHFTQKKLAGIFCFIWTWTNNSKALFWHRRLVDPECSRHLSWFSFIHNTHANSPGYRTKSPGLLYGWLNLSDKSNLVPYLRNKLVFQLKCSINLRNIVSWPHLHTCFTQSATNFDRNQRKI